MTKARVFPLPVTYSDVKCSERSNQFGSSEKPETTSVKPELTASAATSLLVMNSGMQAAWREQVKPITHMSVTLLLLL